MEVRNRVCMAPMDFKFMYGNDVDATLTERAKNVYQARARGGAGLIFTSVVKSERKLDPFPRSLDFPVMDRDERIKEFADTADAVHIYGSRIAAELTAGGGRLADLIHEGEVPVAPSRVVTQYDNHVYTRALTIEEIHYLTDCFGKAAARLKAAGFDAIDVMCSGGYLIAQFLSPVWNKRTDEYGGSEENRMRFLIECIEQVRTACGKKFPIILNLCLDEKLADINPGCLTTGKRAEVPQFDQDGITPDLAVRTAQKLESLGLVDAYECRIGNYYDQEHIVPSAYSDNTEYYEAVSYFSRYVTKPVIFENKLNGPGKLGKLIDSGICDMVSMGRGWLAEPDWVRKAEHNPEDIRPCIRCMKCIENLWNNHYAACAVNPLFGHEAEKLMPASEPKNVLVAGGGPAGKTAAITAAKRGHRVTLVERKDHLGGRLPEAGAVSFKPEINDFCRWLIRETEKAQIRIVLNQEADLDYVRSVHPDVLIDACGAEPFLPPIAGIEKAVSFENVLTDSSRYQGKEIVVIGGGLVGCETAYKLSQECSHVTVVEMMPEILMETSIVYRHAAIRKMEETDVQYRTGSGVTEVTDHGVILKDGSEIHADAVIAASGLRGHEKLYHAAYQEIDEVYAVGDTRRARRVFDAVQEAYRIAADL
ncbi:MAG: FAD-dependent oxidoreductase, partial [Bulleidia sp.]